MRNRLALAAILAGSGVCSRAAAVTIDVDGAAAIAPLQRVWSYYGYDEANYTTSAEGVELLRDLSRLHTAPVYVRTHFLFNTGDGVPALKWGSTNIYTADADGNVVHNYALIDQIMDATLQAGAFPLFQLGFMPEALSTRPKPYQNSSTYVLDGGCFSPPHDYDEWSALVGAWAEHAKERYPHTVSRWQWELWNEPDIGYWQGSFEEYARLYDHTEAALHRVLPDASLGGPAVANPSGSFLTRFLEHCAAGTNAVTGQVGARLDMVSFHAKGGVTFKDGLVQLNLGNQLSLHRAGFEAVAKSAFARAPIVISEADPDGCAACPVSTQPANAYRNSSAYGAYEVAMMKHTLDLADETGVNLRGVLTWAFTFPGSPFFAGYRALATNGIHLPVLNAFKLLGSLEGQRLSLTSSGARPAASIMKDGVREQPEVDALAAVRGDRIQVLVWNYHDELAPAEPAHVALNVALPRRFGASALVTEVRVDSTHGDAYGVWTAQGSPEVPSDQQLAELREAMEPVVLQPEHLVDASDGTLRLTFELPRFGLSLFTIAPTGPGPRELSPRGGSCRLTATQAPSSALLTLSVAAAILRRRRRAVLRRRRRG